ncbi:MAG: hypothetical protein Q8R57_00390 [Bacteroidota bacterium]|nr:hypothetical protein [Bacteroidota bacterium]
MKKIILILFFIGMFITSNLETKAYPILGAFAGFTWVSQDAGWLHCRGVGTCAQVIGGQIFFSNYVGNWDGYVHAQGGDDDDDADYYLEEIVINE